MATSVQEFFKQKPLPKWMTSHPLFKEVKSIQKVFPGIGLPNCAQDFIVNNARDITFSAQRIITDIADQIAKRQASLQLRKAKKPLSKETSDKVSDVLQLLTILSEQMKASKDSFLVKNANNTIAISLPQDIGIKDAKKPIFRKGERLFRVYFKLNELLAAAKCRTMLNIEGFTSFKAFSVQNFPQKPLQIVFSSDGVDGLWDIATMSMRGITSCQAWGGQYHNCLIGSILDPFVGIIYYTSGKSDTQYGTNMIRRCIVRFAIDETTKNKHLVMDNMYPSMDENIAKAFTAFLKEKTGGKLKVNWATEMAETGKLYMPMTALREKLTGDNTREAQYAGIASYQDHFIKSKKSVGKDPQAALFDKNSKKKVSRFSKLFKKTFTEAAKNIDVSTLPKDAQSAITKIIGKKKVVAAEADRIDVYGDVYRRDDGFEYNRTTAIKTIADTIVKDIVASVNKADFANSDTYVRRVFYSYFLRKKEIFNAAKIKLAKQVNGALGHKIKSKVSSKEMLVLLNTLSPMIDSVLKAQLKKLADERKKSFSGAAALPG